METSKRIPADPGHINNEIRSVRKKDLASMPESDLVMLGNAAALLQTAIHDEITQRGNGQI